MRRTFLRGLVLVGIGTLSLTGPGPLALAASGDHQSPSPGSASPSRTDDTPSASPSPTASATTPGTLSPSGTPTATPSPTRTRVHLHTALIDAQSGSGSARARYSVRVRATGGVARQAVATIAVHPGRARFAAPGACHGAATLHCRLGDLHHARLLTFRERPGHAAHRLTVTVTLTAANAPATKRTTVLVLRSTPRRTVREAVPHYVPQYVPPQTITEHELQTVAGPPVRQPAPPATIMSTPDAPLDPGLAGEQAAPAKPRLPVIAPRPGPRPTPNGAPVTVRPVADGHTITGDASGMPTRTIFGLLAAAASFVGLVTALVLIRRRNEG